MSGCRHDGNIPSARAGLEAETEVPGLWVTDQAPVSVSDPMFDPVFTARCTIAQSAVLRLHVVRPSVCDVGGSEPHLGN